MMKKKTMKKFYHTSNDTFDDMRVSELLDDKTYSSSNEDNVSELFDDDMHQVTTERLDQSGEIRDLLDTIHFLLEGIKNKKSLNLRRISYERMINILLVVHHKRILQDVFKSTRIRSHFYDILKSLVVEEDEVVVFLGLTLLLVLFINIYNDEYVNNSLTRDKSIVVNDEGIVLLSYEFFQLVVDVSVKVTNNTTTTTTTTTSSSISPDSSSYKTNNNKSSSSKKRSTKNYLNKRRRSNNNNNNNKSTPSPVFSPNKNKNKNINEEVISPAQLNFSDHQDVVLAYSQDKNNKNNKNNTTSRVNRFRNKRKFSSTRSCSTDSLFHLSREEELSPQQEVKSSEEMNNSLLSQDEVGNVFEDINMMKDNNNNNNDNNNIKNDKNDKVWLNDENKSSLLVIWKFILQDVDTIDLQEDDMQSLESIILVIKNFPSSTTDMILKRLSIYVNMRIIGLLVNQATVESCTSTSTSLLSQDKKSSSSLHYSPSELLVKCLDYQRDVGYTHVICHDLVKTLSHVKKVSTSYTWLMLSYLEGSCFRHSPNQVSTSLLQQE